MRTSEEIRNDAAEFILEEIKATKREYIDYESNNGSCRLGLGGGGYLRIVTALTDALARLLGPDA